MGIAIKDFCGFLIISKFSQFYFFILLLFDNEKYSRQIAWELTYLKVNKNISYYLFELTVFSLYLCLKRLHRNGLMTQETMHSTRYSIKIYDSSSGYDGGGKCEQLKLIFLPSFCFFVFLCRHSTTMKMKCDRGTLHNKFWVFNLNNFHFLSFLIPSPSTSPHPQLTLFISISFLSLLFDSNIKSINTSFMCVSVYSLRQTIDLVDLFSYSVFVLLLLWIRILFWLFIILADIIISQMLSDLFKWIRKWKWKLLLNKINKISWWFQYRLNWNFECQFVSLIIWFIDSQKIQKKYDYYLLLFEHW